jgi:hypothetical protein
MKECSNCRDFFIKNNEECLNCGFNEVENTIKFKLQHLNFHQMNKEVLTDKAKEGAIVVFFAAVGWLTVFSAAAMAKVTLSPTLFWIFTALSGLVALGGLFKLALAPFWAAVLTEKGKHNAAPESLLGWESELTSQKQRHEKKLTELRQLLRSGDELITEESAGVTEAIEFVMQQISAIKKKLASFQILRWQNKVESLINEVISDQATLDLEPWQIGSRIDYLTQIKNEGEMLLDDGNFEMGEENAALRSTFEKIDDFKRNLHRLKTLKVLQSVKPEQNIGAMPERELTESSIRLQLTAGDSQPVTSEMFEKERLRLEMAKLLSR